MRRDSIFWGSGFLDFRAGGVWVFGFGVFEVLGLGRDWGVSGLALLGFRAFWFGVLGSIIISFVAL